MIAHGESCTSHASRKGIIMHTLLLYRNAL